jgi:hypothetical protein
MSEKIKAWNDPQPEFKVVYREVKTKSRAGVEYSHLVPMVEGRTSLNGPNRLARRKKISYERSIKYRKLQAKKARNTAKQMQKSDNSLLKIVKNKLINK